MKRGLTLIAGLFIVLFCAFTAQAAAHDTPTGAEEKKAASGEFAPEGASGAPWLGITVREAGSDPAKRRWLKEPGAIIVDDVIRGGPAEDAGLEEGDVIVTLNGEPVKGVDDFISAIRNARAGDTVNVGIMRRGEAEEYEVVLGEMPRDASAMIAVSHGHDYGMDRRGYGMEDHAAGVCAEDAFGGRDMGMHGMTGMHPMDCMMGMHKEAKYGKITKEMVDALKLTDEQDKKAVAARSDYLKRRIRAEAEIRVAEIELDDILSADKVSLDMVKSKLRGIAEKRAELRFLSIKSFEDFKGILNDGQKKTLKEMTRAGMHVEAGFGMGH